MPPVATIVEHSGVLRVFAQAFYVEAVADLIDAALTFVERYKGVHASHAIGWKLMAFWVTSKFGKFQSLIVSRDIDTAQEVQQEFSRVDEDLLELLDLRRSHCSSEPTAHRRQSSQNTFRRGERQRRQASVPAPVLAALSCQSDKRLCMKSISVVECSGDGTGGCFDSKRAHFRPKFLPDILKLYHGNISRPTTGGQGPMTTEPPSSPLRQSKEIDKLQ